MTRECDNTQANQIGRRFGARCCSCLRVPTARSSRAKPRRGLQPACTRKEFRKSNTAHRTGDQVPRPCVLPSHLDRRQLFGGRGVGVDCVSSLMLMLRMQFRSYTIASTSLHAHAHTTPALYCELRPKEDSACLDSISSQPDHGSRTATPTRNACW